ncbi:MAG: divergent polysaccharide deacetylase family protein [Woeseiaceae bacterium]
MSKSRSFLLVIVTMLGLSSAAHAQGEPRITIIIDDLGYQFDLGVRAINLPGPVSFAILPAAPNSGPLARAAYGKGKEVLLHLPFESIDRENVNEPGAITLDMSRQMFHETFEAGLASVPHAIGVSNHRGSLLTRHPGHMAWLMEEIAAREGMFFVDSYTTHESVAIQMAAESGIAATRRNVFLDNDRTPGAISREFDRLIALARRHGKAVAIGHPYPETLEFLENKLVELQDSDIKLIPVSQAVNSTEPAPMDKL